jgi:hypothetical protein
VSISLNVAQSAAVLFVPSSGKSSTKTPAQRDWLWSSFQQGAHVATAQRSKIVTAALCYCQVGQSKAIERRAEPAAAAAGSPLTGSNSRTSIRMHSLQLMHFLLFFGTACTPTPAAAAAAAAAAGGDVVFQQ